LQGENAVAISAIAGMGGIGKTELAVQYARTHLEQNTYPGGVVWLKAREDVASQIVLFARSLPMPQPPDDFEPAEKVAFYWRNWQAAQTLVILDDVQDYGAIKPLLPVDPHFKILLTTRSTLQSPVRKFAIQVLSEEHAIALLRAIATQGTAGKDLRFLQEIADLERQLCQWLGYLPLALELVGRYLALESDLSLEEMLARLQKERLQQEALVRNEHDPMWTSNAERGVAAAFELSWQTLDVAAKQLGELLSLFALASIPWDLVEATIGEMNATQRQRLQGWRQWLKAVWRWRQWFWRQRHPSPSKVLNSIVTVEKARRSLLGLHLLQRNEEQQMYQLHQLLREFFAAKREQRADTDRIKQTVCRVMVAVGQQIPQTPTLTVIEQVTPAIPHLQEVATTLAPWLPDQDLIEPATRLAWFYTGQSAYAEALRWSQACLTAAESRFGADHPLASTSLNNLALLYQSQGRTSEAEPLYLRALAISEQQLGSDHPDAATSLNNLADLYRSQGRYSEAEPLHRRSLAIREQQLSADHPAVAQSLNNLAALYKSQGRTSEAEPLQLRALAISEQQLGADHPDVAISLNNLANLYRSQGRYTEAEPLHLRALAIKEQQLGADHPDVATSLNNLAELYQSQGRYSEAEPLFRLSLAIYEQQLGADHPHVALSLNNLAGLYESQGRYREAELLYGRAVAILFNRLGQDHPHTQTVWNNFLGFLRQVVQEGQTAQLSDHPLTQDLLRQIQEG
jgi:tetratricopeptide (TPR) repeat protein